MGLPFLGSVFLLTQVISVCIATRDDVGKAGWMFFETTHLIYIEGVHLDPFGNMGLAVPVGLHAEC